jgi:hypothetical protein
MPDVLFLLGIGGLGVDLFVLITLDGTTACEEAVVSLRFCFEHFFYSSAILIL